MTDNARWAEIKALFGEALELTPADRTRLLDARCAADPNLRREVESLLASHDAAGDFIETPASVTLAPEDRSRAGDLIGPYRIEREIGRGGMGAVYLAVRADDAYRKRVAVKVIKRGMDTDEIVARFRRERQTLANLDHPNIARLLDGGTTDDGLPYFVMEYVEGEPLDRYCESRALSIRERLRLFRTVCSAVQFAHRNLVVHRDLKPDNILVTADGTPKLLDFGIAKLLTGADGGTVAPTRAAERMMTLDYASPEQLRGEAVSTATDVFSLGVMLYELVSGRHPFRRDGRPAYAIEVAICEDEPLRPGAGEIDLIVLMAIRKEPSRRYGAANELDDDLRRHLEGLPVAAHADSVGYRASKFVRRHKVGVAASALIAASLVAGIIGVSTQARIAAAERDRARVEADKARRVSAVLEQMLRAADPAVDGKDVTVAAVLGEASRRARIELAAQPDVRAAVRAAIGNTYYSLGLYDEAAAELQEALSLSESLHGRDAVETTDARVKLAYVHLEQGDVEAAERGFARAMTSLEAARARDVRDVRSRVINAMGLMAARRGQSDAAIAHYREALDITRALYGDMDLRVAEITNNLAVQAQAKANLDEAERLYRDALRVAQTLQGERHPGYATALSNLAGVMHSQGRLIEARPLYEQALALRTELLGADHSDLAFTEFNYADLLLQQGEFEPARAVTARILARRGRALPERHPIVPAALINQGRARLGLGDGAGAERDIREGLMLRRAMMPPDHWLIANTESILGECLMVRGRVKEAEPLLVWSYQRLLANRGPAHERTRDARARLVRLYETTGRPQLAAGLRSPATPRP
ncbi:MAG: serine/threonine-protein kinase [Vicinamibacterales bacterium]